MKSSSADAGMAMADIELGKKYRISLDNASSIATLQFHFKPVSVANQQGASLKENGSGDAVLNIDSCDGKREQFKGSKRVMTASDHEFVLVKDGDTFKLRKVDHAVLNLRVQREEDETKTRLQSAEESKQLLESKRLLPKFLQKQQAQKKKSAEQPKNPALSPNATTAAPTVNADGVGTKLLSTSIAEGDTPVDQTEA
jgi:hypothetical protein